MIVSVPHTGTQFLGSLIGGQRSHVFETNLEWQLERDGTHHGQIYTPLRDPKKVSESWARRYSEKRIRATGYKNGGMVSLEECWELLCELDEKHDIFYMPIDVNREYHLERLSTHVGFNIETDWRKVASWEHKPIPEIDPAEYEWVYDLPMIKQYYSLGDLDGSNSYRASNP